MCALTARLRAPAGTISPSLHVIPPGTAPSLCHAPDPHCDHELAESQRISPSVQDSPPVEGEEEEDAGAEEVAAEATTAARRDRMKAAVGMTKVDHADVISDGKAPLAHLSTVKVS